MAYPMLRSLNDDLTQGAADGRYKSEAPNRGGVVEPTTAKFRNELDTCWYGYQGSPSSYPAPLRPDGIHGHQRGRAALMSGW